MRDSNAACLIVQIFIIKRVREKIHSKVHKNIFSERKRERNLAAADCRSTHRITQSVRVKMNILKASKLLAKQNENSSPSFSMIFKLSSLAFLLLFCYTSVSTYFVVGRVAIPDGCAAACPPQGDPSRYICARNKMTGRLGMFDGECYFGRYNHCVHVREREL